MNKTVSALLKLLYPAQEMEVPDDELEPLVRTALEMRRRVKEQQKRVFRSEFRNTHFSYTLGEDGVEKFVAPPELRTDDAIDPDPLPPGQIWGISPTGKETGASLYRIEVSAGPRQRRAHPQRTDSAIVPRERPLRGAKPLRPRQGTGGRPRPALPRIHRATARDGQRPLRRRAWLPTLLALCGALWEKAPRAA